MSDELSPILAAARALIVDERYAEARALLLTLPGDPTAESWLSFLDSIAPSTAQPSGHMNFRQAGGIFSANPRPLNWLAIRLIGVLVILLVMALFLNGKSSPLSMFPPFQTIAANYKALPQTLVAAKPLLLTTATSSQTGGWTVSTEVPVTQNSAQNSNQSQNKGPVTLRLSAVGESTYFGTQIQIVCDRGQLTVAFDDMMVTALLTTPDPVKVSYYFDSQPAQTFTYTPDFGAGGRVEFPDPVEMLQALKSHWQMWLVAPPNHNSNDKSAHFMLFGLQPALAAMRGQCGQ